MKNKTINVYGVELTPIQSMKFDKWRELNCKAPNTVSTNERYQMVVSFLESEKTKTK